MGSWMTDGASVRRSVPWIKVLILAFSIGLWMAFRHVAPVPDVAWLTEGARRWMNGARLFVDVREVNPPLIFYEIVALSAGTTANQVFVGGVAVATAVSSLWVARHHGDMLGLGTFVSIVFAGLVEFGQRDHLLLVFVVPYLLARGGRWERVLMGFWAFFGVGLKPHFLLVVALPALVEAWRDRTSLFEPQKLALAGACVAYVIAAFLLYPAYFREMVPLARETYTYGSALPPFLLLESVAVAGAVLLADAERRPFAAAALGGLGSYYLQGRLWPYHFIPAAGLGMILCFWQRRLALWAVLLFAQAYLGPYRRGPQSPIPEGITRVVVLSVHPSAAYPTVTGCGATNETPWGSLGWVPGSWNIVTDLNKPTAERERAWNVLVRERARLRRLVQTTDTQLIIADISPRKAYFERPFDYMQFLGPFPGFKPVRRVGRFELWAKGPVSTRLCKERF